MRGVSVMNFLGTIIPLDWLDLQQESTSWAELHLAQHWALLGWRLPCRKLNWKAATRTNWHMVLLAGSSSSSAAPNGTVQGWNAPHPPPAVEGVILHYCSAIRDFTSKRCWTHKFQARNLSWEDGKNCDFSTLVHWESRNVSKRLWQLFYSCYQMTLYWNWLDFLLWNVVFEAKVLFEIQVWFKNIALLKYLICKAGVGFWLSLNFVYEKYYLFKAVLIGITKSVRPTGSVCFCVTDPDSTRCVQQEWRAECFLTLNQNQGLVQ